MTYPERLEAIGALRRYRRLESEVYQQLAAELEEAGHSIDPGSLAWAVDQAQARLRKAVGL